ncbi:MAG: hypothetical protein KAR20_01850, partial [Candidatus Heimdallarchaeota archaeon]|nr:hypothetical protein [Candidatus Heimdallarchaeota archaeon]
KSWVKQGRVADHFEIAHPWVDPHNDGIPEDVHSKSRNWIASLSHIRFLHKGRRFRHFGAFTG